jgi:hypothetical protein
MVTWNSVGEGGCYLYQCQEEKVLEHHSSLHASEKELPEWRSGVFHHKNTPGPMLGSSSLTWHLAGLRVEVIF